MKSGGTKRERPISLHPLPIDEIVRDVLTVKPPEKPKKRPRKRQKRGAGPSIIPADPA